MFLPRLTEDSGCLGSVLEATVTQGKADSSLNCNNTSMEIKSVMSLRDIRSTGFDD